MPNLKKCMLDRADRKTYIGILFILLHHLLEEIHA